MTRKALPTGFQIFDHNGRPMGGAMVRFFQLDETPLTAYADENMSQEIGSSVTADENGRLPSDVFVARPYSMVITDRFGDVVVRYDGIA